MCQEWVFYRLDIKLICNRNALLLHFLKPYLGWTFSGSLMDGGMAKQPTL